MTISSADLIGDITKRPWVTCSSCGWVMFTVPRAYAEKQVEEFNTYFWGLPQKQRLEFYGGRCASIKNYEHCMSCGAHHDTFRAFLAHDLPGQGHTINPILEPKWMIERDQKLGEYLEASQAVEEDDA